MDKWFEIVLEGVLVGKADAAKTSQKTVIDQSRHVTMRAFFVRKNATAQPVIPTQLLPQISGLADEAGEEWSARCEVYMHNVMYIYIRSYVYFFDIHPLNTFV